MNILDFIIGIDKAVATFLSAHQDASFYHLMSLITILGDWWFVLILLLIFFWVLEERGKYWRFSALAFGFAGTQAVVFSLKYLVGRPRPEVEAYSFLKHFVDTPSFPSGHAATAMVFYGLLMYFMLTFKAGKTGKKEKARSIKKKAESKWPMLLSGAFIILMIGFSRLYLGVHYLSDVLAGFLIGGIFLYLSIQIANRHVPSFVWKGIEKWKKEYPHLVRRGKKNDTITEKKK